MPITLRRYKLLSDFERVSDFLRKNFTKFHQNGNVPQPFWEYAHTHPHFNHKLTHRFGLWEDNGEIIAVAAYEMDLGLCILATKIGYEQMKPSMVEYAERELFKEVDNKKHLKIIVFNYENHLKDNLIYKGFILKNSRPVTVFKYEKGFLRRSLPEGFSVITLEDENDIQKIHEVLWRGFDHGDNPSKDSDGRMLMQSGPGFRKDLATIIKAPNGDYACYAGMWLDGVNDFAYLEPLATDPRYRRMGLATIALTESMKRTMEYGASYCFGGSREFYHSIGFETVCNIEIWSKEW